VETWAAANNLKMNTSKSVEIVFENPAKKDEPQWLASAGYRVSRQPQMAGSHYLEKSQRAISRRLSPFIVPKKHYTPLRHYRLTRCGRCLCIWPSSLSPWGSWDMRHRLGLGLLRAQIRIELMPSFEKVQGSTSTREITPLVLPCVQGPTRDYFPPF